MGVLNEYVNLADGEILRLLPVADSQPDSRRHYAYPGGYVTMGLINITRLVNSKLPADGYRLALLIAVKVAPVSSLCYCANREYASELGVSCNRIAHLIQQMCKCGFLYRMNRRLVMVNPGWCFRGTPTEHYQAMETWARLHPLGIVRGPNRLEKAS